MDSLGIIILFLIVGAFSRLSQARMKRPQSGTGKPEGQKVNRGSGQRSIEGFYDKPMPTQPARRAKETPPKTFSPYAESFGEGKALEVRSSPAFRSFEGMVSAVSQPLPGDGAAPKKASVLGVAEPEQAHAPLWHAEALRQAVVAQVVLGAPRGRQPWSPSRAHSKPLYQPEQAQ